MLTTTHQKNQNRSITVNFQNEATYHRLRHDGCAFVEFVVAFITSFGFQLMHTCGCSGGCALTRHSSYVRVRVGNLVIWRLQCKHCRAVFTILPHFVLRYHSMTPEHAKQALLAVYGGLSLEWTGMVVPDVSPMGAYRLLCSLGHTSLVSVLVRCGLPLPPYLLADEKHSQCLDMKVYLPTIVSGRVIWHLGYTTDKSAASFQRSYAEFQQAALCHDPAYSPKGIGTDGFDSTRLSLGTLFPKAALGNCWRHAAHRLGQKLQGVSKTVRETLSRDFYALLQSAKSTKLIPVVAFSQKLRRFADTVDTLAGTSNGTKIRAWFQEKKPGWYVLIEHPQMPITSTLLDQAHNMVDRKLFMMKGFHHKGADPTAFLTALALLYNFVPYQRRAASHGHSGIEVEGGRMPAQDWFLNLRIATSGGFV
jgi:hypothetical protein